MIPSIQKISTSPQRTLFYGILVLLFLTGIFFRTYHFADWLHFETDQVDDYFAVAPAIETGLGKLPLVGPKAAGTDLRLGPMFYFFEYIGAVVVGNTPAGHASATLFFSILAVPLFFAVSRIFFEKIISLFLASIFSTSLFFILYARFSWNPNLLPFFTLLIIFTLTKALSETTEKRQVLWLSLCAIAIAITMQLHIAALITIPLFIGCFLLWRRPSIAIRAWMASAIFFLLVFTPTILYEIHTQGQTLHALLSKTSTESEKTPGEYSLRLIQNIRYHAGEYFLILTSHDAINATRPSGSSLGMTCSSCTTEAPYRAAGYLFFVTSILLLWRRIRQETDTRKKDFLILIFLWFASSFLFFFSIMLSGKYLYPRFFLLVSPIPLFFFGFFLQSIDPKKNSFRFSLALVLTVFIMSLNMRAVIETLTSNRLTVSSKDIVVETEDIFPNTQRITLQQQQKIADFITARARDAKVPLYLKSESEYEPSLWLLLAKNNINFYSDTSDASGFPTQGLYVFIFRSASPLTKSMQIYQEKFFIVEEIPFGSLTLRILTPKPEFTISARQTEKQSYPPIQSALDILRFEDLAR